MLHKNELSKGLKLSFERHKRRKHMQTYEQ